MKGFSKAIIAGNMTRDPETRATPGGASVTGFTLAVNRNYKDASGADREQTSFIDCSAWGKAGEIIAQYSKKGSAILVSGRLDQRSWEDKETKQKRSKIEVVVEDFSFLGGKDGGSSAGGGRSSSSADVVPDDIDADEGIDLSEIPF
jgi:single-strand DNA-binding protein